MDIVVIRIRYHQIYVILKSYMRGFENFFWKWKTNNFSIVKFVLNEKCECSSSLHWLYSCMLNYSVISDKHCVAVNRFRNGMKFIHLLYAFPKYIQNQLLFEL